ncbi:glycosyltransferase family 4 protein [Candidatus Nanosalina sp. VS9-1]|uniref:glycosyltransferase family 4 protein n=1 Tax=Candidatus Nanosalina sp. VS9-1 TaxID=3388566 RepID=UPI0039E0DB37
MDKKILLTGWGFPPDIDGGLDIHVKHLFEQLESRGLDVKLFLPSENAPDMENVEAIDTGDGDMVQKAREMSAEVARQAENFDIVHTHDWFGAEAGFKAKKYSDAKWISTMHSLSSSRSRKSYGALEELEKTAVEHSDKLLAVSEKLGDEIEDRYGKRPQVIHNGFSRPSKEGKNIREELNIDNDMIFFVGRHAEQKGLEHLLYGFRKFLDDGGEATLVVGGDGHLTETLKDFTEILGLENDVVFTGFIPDRELGDYYQSADLFVSPSINEPFGLTITEALESGTVVAATESGVEEVLSGEYIVSIDPDSDSIAEGISKGLEKDFPGVFESRTWGDMADEVLEVYRGL